jgi:hypothetical protein
MAEVAQDLAAWKSLGAEPSVLDLSEEQRKLRVKLEKAIDEEDAIAEFIRQANIADRRLKELMSPLNDELKKLYPRAEVDLRNDRITREILKLYPAYGQSIVWQRTLCTKVTPPRVLTYPLRFA